MNVKFAEEATVGESVLHLSIAGFPKAIAEKLRTMANEIDSSYGKPYQGINSSWKCVSHVITPIWNGKEY